MKLSLRPNKVNVCEYFHRNLLTRYNTYLQILETFSPLDNMCVIIEYIK